MSFDFVIYQVEVNTHAHHVGCANLSRLFIWTVFICILIHRAGMKTITVIGNTKKIQRVNMARDNDWKKVKNAYKSRLL